jgi:kynurenine formamidase
MNPDKIKALINTGKVYDLGMEYYVGMPHHPNHPPFAFSLTKKHGELVYEGGVSASNCLFTTGGHTGTHFDAMGHISLNGAIHGVDDITPWLDIAGLEGVSCLDADYRIGAATLQKAMESQKVRIEKGDAVLIRTGWIQHFDDPLKYVSHHEGCPGLVVDGAQLLVKSGAAYVGADTVALEKTPAPNLPVHVVLIVKNGVHILEALYLEELAADGVYDFLFMASPLKIRGGTASPVRPVAVA